MSAITEDGKLVPKLKLSENVTKTTIPGFKQLYRFYDESNKAIADLITLHDEEIDESKPYVLFDPEHPYKRKTVTNFTVKRLLEPIFIGGKLVYEKPSLEEIRAYHQEQMKTLWDEVTRIERPHQYYVDYSQDLWDLQQKLILHYKNNNGKK